MKSITYIISILFILAIFSCSDDNNDSQEDLNKEIEGLIKVTEISNDEHIIEIYSTKTKLYLGYNELTMRIVDKLTGEFITNATLDWMPVMHMTEKNHSCPKSEINKTAGMKTTYGGFIIFQMAGMMDNGWTLSFDYSISGVSYSAIGDIDVMMSERQVVSVFTGADDVKYVLALIAPADPEVKINDMSAGLYKMESMMSFPVVKNYSVELDPRMPSMGNHGSPNNEDLVYSALEENYQGKLSLTMTGYWKLNLRLLNENQELVKGELVTEENDSSSLYLEIEF
jgi:hypothetical protein